MKINKFGMFAAAVSVLLISFLFLSYAYAADDWLSGWGYRIPVTITNSSATGLTNYQIKISLNSTNFNYASSSFPQSGKDLRLTDGSGVTNIPYYIENWNSNGTSTIWTKVSSLGASTSSTLYLYFGNSQAATSSNASSTFLYHEDFTPGDFLEDSSTYAGFEAMLPPARYAGNPIISNGMTESGSGWKEHQVQEPIVLIDPHDSSKLIMYYAAMEEPLGDSVMSIGMATSTVADPFTWNESPDNPILSPGSNVSDWDSRYMRLDSVIYVDGVYYMYYTGQSLESVSDSIGLATSTDGIHFTKYPTPVLTPGGQGRADENFVSAGAVLKEGNMWYMYYDYRNVNLLPGIRYATSSDGLNWSKVNVPDLISREGGVYNEDVYDSTLIEWHQIFKVGDTYVIIYSSFSGAKWYAAIAYSSSPTGPFTKSLKNPILSGSGVPGTFDFRDVATPSFTKINGKWYLFYQGGDDLDYNDSLWDMGMAVLNGRPVLPETTTCSGDDNIIQSDVAYQGYALQMPDVQTSIQCSFSPGSTQKSFSFYIREGETLSQTDYSTVVYIREGVADITAISFQSGRWQHLISGAWQNMSTPNPSPNQWYKVTISFPNKTTHKISIDDVPQTLANSSNFTNIVSSADNIRLQRYANETGSSYFDEISVREYILTEPTSQWSSFEVSPIVYHSIVSSAGDHGSISPLGETIIEASSDQDFVITPDEGYRVGTLLIDDVSVSTSTSYSFTDIDEDHTISVSFEADPVIVEPPITPPEDTVNTPSPGVTHSSSGSRVSIATLIALGLLPNTSNVPGCPVGYVCTPEPISLKFTRNLQIYDIGADVKSLQQYLNSVGYLIAIVGPGSIGNETTMFGALTKKALMKFQKDHSIPSTGYFGPMTRAFLNK